MLLVIEKVLTPTQINVIQKLLASSEFVDGKLSAGSEAKRVKKNQEVKGDDSNLELLNTTLMNALLSNPDYQASVFPTKVATPFYARYQKDMEYGYHVDDPVMGPMGGRYRTDIATTVFLSDADEYEGGELEIQLAQGTQTIKCDAGGAVVYPADSLHRVRPVTKGERVVAVTWAQSMVRDAARRRILYDLSSARDSLLKTDAESDVTHNVSASYVNLLRMWADV